MKTYAIELTNANWNKSEKPLRFLSRWWTECKSVKWSRSKWNVKTVQCPVMHAIPIQSVVKRSPKFIHLVQSLSVLFGLVVINIPSVFPVGSEQRHHEFLQVPAQIALQVFFQITLELCTNGKRCAWKPAWAEKRTELQGKHTKFLHIWKVASVGCGKLPLSDVWFHDGNCLLLFRGIIWIWFVTFIVFLLDFLDLLVGSGAENFDDSTFICASTLQMRTVKRTSATVLKRERVSAAVFALLDHFQLFKHFLYIINLKLWSWRLVLRLVRSANLVTARKRNKRTEMALLNCLASYRRGGSSIATQTSSKEPPSSLFKSSTSS